MAVTSDGEAHATLPEAVARALELDGVVDVCPGTHEVEGNLDTTTGPISSLALDIRGRGRDKSTLRATGEGAWASWIAQSARFSELAIENARTVWDSDACSPPGESDIECDSPFDRNGRPEGSLSVYGDWSFERVRIADNQGYWGGALTLWQAAADDEFAVAFVDSEIIRNAALDDTSGGAVLVQNNDSWGRVGKMTITSINTDWGSGDTDNTPDDIAFASWDGYFKDSLVVHASYSFDGVADFTCDAATYTCE